MKSYKIFSLAAVVAASAMLTACDDDKQLTTGGEQVSLLEKIEFEVSDVLPLPVGMDSTITYTYGPETADDITIVFTSSDETVATVDQNGTIRGVKVGQAIITARAGFPYKVYDAEASVSVNVVPELIKAEQIVITNTTPASNEEGLIFVTDELQLAAEILPADHTYSRLIWSSADESIATVDQTGKVVCTGDGDAVIYATATDRSGTRGEFRFHINKYIAAESVSIKELTAPVCWTLGAFALDVTYEPAGATIGSVEWSSDNESVATVHRGVVTPTGFGICNITAKCIENGATASVTVNVDPGWYIWDASNQWNWWEVANNDAPDTRGDKTWHIQLKDPNGGKWGRNIRVKGIGHPNPIVMHLNNYPVLAVRMTKLNGGVSKLDDAVSNLYPDAKRKKELNPGNGIDLGDGTQLLIYNLGENYDVTEVGFRVFQFKITDIPNGNIDASKAYYDVYWIRTFKSEAEAQSFADEQVRAGN